MKLYIKEENLDRRDIVEVCDENLKRVYSICRDDLLLSILDETKNVLATVQTRDSRWLKQSDIYFDDSLVACLKKDVSSFVGKVYVDPLNYEIRGSIANHDIQIFKGQDIVVTYRKKWLTYQSAYEIALEDSEDPLIVVAVIATLEMSNMQ